jgi:hypothetical protein
MVNRRGKPFRDPSQVEAHIDGSHDGAHQEERGSDHREQIEENAQEVEEFEEPAEPPSVSDSLQQAEVPVVLSRGEDGTEEEEMPVRDAVRVTSDMAQHATGAHDKADAALELVEELREENEELRGAVEELYAAVERLAEEQDMVASWEYRNSPSPSGVMEDDGDGW